MTAPDGLSDVDAVLAAMIATGAPYTEVEEIAVHAALLLTRTRDPRLMDAARDVVTRVLTARYDAGEWEPVGIPSGAAGGAVTGWAMVPATNAGGAAWGLDLRDHAEPVVPMQWPAVPWEYIPGEASGDMVRRAVWCGPAADRPAPVGVCPDCPTFVPDSVAHANEHAAGHVAAERFSTADHDCTPACPVPCPFDDDDPRGWRG